MIDFNEIRSQVKAWIDENWDHGFLVSDYDNIMKDFLEQQGQKHYVLNVAYMEHLHRERGTVLKAVGSPFETICNPSVENLSLILRDKTCGILGLNFSDVRVRLYESSSGWVDTL